MTYYLNKPTVLSRQPDGSWAGSAMMRAKGTSASINVTVTKDEPFGRVTLAMLEKHKAFTGHDQAIAYPQSGKVLLFQ